MFLCNRTIYFRDNLCLQSGIPVCIEVCRLAKKYNLEIKFHILEKVKFSKIIGIIHDGRKIKNIDLFNKDTLDIDHLFCTLPLNILINILYPSPPKEIIERIYK